MRVPIQPSTFYERLEQFLKGSASYIGKANELTGGGGYENWMIVQFINNLTSHVDYDYQREFGVVVDKKRLRIDLVLNTNRITKETPLILTEWKCNPDHNKLSSGFFDDIQKFVDVLQAHPSVGGIPTLPVIIGVGPAGAALPGGASTDLANTGIFLYISTIQTWQLFGVVDKTWYSQFTQEPGTGSNQQAPSLPSLDSARSEAAAYGAGIP